MFSCVFCEISKKIFFDRTPPLAASKRQSFKIDHFWALCQQVLGHDLKNLTHRDLIGCFLLLKEKRDDLRMTWGIFGRSIISIASFNIFLFILLDFDSLAYWNLVRMTWNFQRTCFYLSSDRCVKRSLHRIFVLSTLFQRAILGTFNHLISAKIVQIT